MHNDNLIDGFETPKAAGRPAFLTVLCILTWTGSAIVVGLNGYSYLSLSAAVKEWPIGIPKEISWMLWNMLVACAGSLLCVFGSIVMWNLRRWGFYVYLAGQIVPIAMNVYITLILTNSLVSGQLLYVAAWVLIPIAFIILYAMNLKHLCK